MRISDWSSDVFSSDLKAGIQYRESAHDYHGRRPTSVRSAARAHPESRGKAGQICRLSAAAGSPDLRQELCGKHSSLGPADAIAGRQHPCPPDSSDLWWRVQSNGVRWRTASSKQQYLLPFTRT